MGIEAANDRIRVDLLKRRMTREDIVDCGRMVRAAGIHIHGNQHSGHAQPARSKNDLDTMRLNAASAGQLRAWLVCFNHILGLSWASTPKTTT